ncbi:PCMD domain-containing protein [Bacteroides eggerthii]|uniref:PCMD domain-containing protein n=1 Tax=Bacteroides eggerthii TaxID=28111 RepID=UPI001FD2006E|nr:PCMD domain-containing protein [Bacteroides eggerthii]
MKKNLFYLFALICSMSLFTACSDDDPDYSKVIEEEIAGNYKGTLDIKLDGTTIASSLPKNITISKAGNSAINLLLADFTLMTMDLGDIELKNCQLSQKDNSYSFTGTQSLSIDQYQLTADVKAAGTIEDGKITVLLDIAAKLNGASQKVQVTYTGTKLTGSESSEAKITAFTFDSKFVTEQPVINEEEGTIIFKVDEKATAADLSALVPVITISEGAVVTPGSGEAKDFSNGNRVAYTVLSEDYSQTKTYTAFVAGTQKVKEYSFDEWSKDTSNSEEALQFPVIGTDYKNQLWASCNQAVMLIKSMGALGGITYTGDYPVRPTDDAVSGKAILMESVFTTGGNIFGTPVPKVTAATVFLGKFKAMAAMGGNAMKSTEFGIMFSDKPLEVKGSFKYTSGTPFYNKEGAEVDKKDECAISAVLYEVQKETETLNGENIYTAGNIVASAIFYSGDQQEYTPFSLKLIYHKEYDATKKYKFAVIFSASKDGAAYEAAVGSKLLVDNVSIICE